MSIISIADDFVNYCNELSEEMSRPMRGSVDYGIVKFVMSIHSLLISEHNQGRAATRDVQEELVLREMSLSVGLLLPEALSALRAAVDRERSMFLTPDFDEFGNLSDDVKLVSIQLSEALSSKMLNKLDFALLRSVGEITSIIWRELERQKRPRNVFDDIA